MVALGTSSGRRFTRTWVCAPTPAVAALVMTGVRAAWTAAGVVVVCGAPARRTRPLVVVPPLTAACAPPTVTPTGVVLRAVVAGAVTVQPDVVRRAAVALIEASQAVVIARALAAGRTSRSL